MRKVNTPVIRRSLSSWVLSSNLKLQALLLVIIMITVLTRVLPLEMQKRIINEAIRFGKIQLLLTYCGLYLAAVLLATGLKYVISALQTLIGERALAEMRKDLYHHILTLPLNTFRKIQPGMVVSSLVTELAAAGNFVGMAIAVPATSILTLVAFAVYLFWLNPLLALISLSIYPMVLFLLPRMQNRANRANKRRVDTTRALSSKIGEAITGIHEIHGNGSYRIENRRYSKLIEALFKIRITWNLYKFGVKSLNNFFNNLSPFLVFIVGGYLSIMGRLDLGALVAFLSAQEKLFDPWRELIAFYQAYQDGSVRYKRTMEYFDSMPEYALEPEGREPYELEGSIEIKDLSFVVEGGIQLLDQINLSLKPGEQLALVGFSGSGKSTLALCVGQLYKYTGGHLLIGGKEVADLSKKDMTQNMGFVSQAPFTFEGTIKENLVYSCAAKLDGEEANGGEAMPSLDDMIEALQQTGIFVDVLRFGLNTMLLHDEHTELVSKLIRVRENFKRDFGEELAEYVEFFDENNYLFHSTVAANLTFGSPNRKSFALENLSVNRYFLEFLNEADLTRPLLRLGADLCEQTVDILGNLPPDKVFFEQSPIGADELDGYKLLVERLKKRKLHQLSPEDVDSLLRLALRFIPGKHKMVGLADILEELILEGRALFREKISRDDPEAFSFYQASEYIHTQTILDNILFGKTKTVNPMAEEKIDQSIIRVLIEEDLLETIVEIGMEFQVGSKGDRLSGGQRQKLAIARVFLKAPQILIMDEATSALDNKSQSRIQSLLDTRWKGKSTLIAVVHRLDIVKNYDKIAVMKAGRIGEVGTYDELIARKGMLHELIYGKKSTV
ncbi:MAG: ABC transporter ATP-binding protein/permease [Deltaproteobacteria bacterium]|nr:MAG: ABC transporter ATP-binding protein/permease [Deltaproteobacteria bacterium]